MPSTSSRPELAQAERQFIRSVLAGLLLLGVVAVAGPLLSYRGDVAGARAEFRTRMTREARVYAEALGLHLKLLQTELLRVSEGVGPDVKRELPTEDLQDLTTPRAGLFHAGVMVLDAQGKPRWSDPPLLADASQGDFAARPWFQQVLARQTPVVDAIAPGASSFVVAVPVVRAGVTTAVLAGLLDTNASLPGGRPLSSDLELLVLNASGDLFLPTAPPSWASVPRAAGELRAFIREGTRPPSLDAAPETFVTATPVPGTELHLLLAADETALLSGLRDRFLVQLLVLALLQVGTLVLFTIHWRRVYGLFREVEDRAAQQEKMAALGSAASLIAHEVKNSLNGLKAATGLVPPEGEGGLVVRTLYGQIDRLAHLATSLLNFGKPPVVRRVDVDLSRLVRDVVEGLRSLPEAGEVRVDVEVPQDAAPLSCDPLLLTTALDNLVRNAMEATVAAKDLGRVAQPQVWVRARFEADAAVVTVEDNGGGPPEGAEGRLFEPFRTSKPRGIGLGLAMTRQALEHQGGQLTFERLPDGSRFLLHLPRAPRA
ncbi:ATP-binding protein [Corallococcus sp. BB11-1]|uniref:sensor histidine kinase n=1 Tax=Corallococcus sp. BB11-1 TaxID=2996783 RepID=UPI00226F10DA|nr:ATP-binding protein [Corallococcus sp. BB11-1]MCY1036276.1 ATP-binding protein [Corallococcus sp. BB11-1]